MRHHDLVVWGATGFTGSLVAEYLAKNYKDLKWAIAGRSMDKLVQLQNDLQKYGKKIDYLVADAGNQQSLDSLVMQTKVIISTVGPFALYGEMLVDACVRMKTHYIVSTGEVSFVKKMIEKHHEMAVKNKVFIISCCGFDCVPSDLGAYLIAHKLKTEFNEPVDSVRFSLAYAKGGFSGGTLASMLNLVKEPLSELKKIASPFCLVQQSVTLPTKPKRKLVTWNDALKVYEANWLMDAVNVPIVYRSWSLLKYGSDFKYSEGMQMKGYFKALISSISLSVLGAALFLPPVQWIVKKYGPKQGEGPSKEQLSKGCFKIIFTGVSPTGKTASVEISSSKDGGYVETAKMLVESALCLISNAESVGKHDAFGIQLDGGVLTPASAFGIILSDRLNKDAYKILFTQINARAVVKNYYKY